MKDLNLISSSELQQYQDAFHSCNLAEPATPWWCGHEVDDTDTYNKTRRMLNCPEMEEAHGFLYEIDFDHLTQQVVDKVNALYELAQNKGFIEKPVEPAEQSGATEETPVMECEEDVEQQNPGIETAWVCLYSAMKGDEIKTGECYSNAADPQSAKYDAISKLTNLGFHGIEIIAVEAGDPAAVGAPTAVDDTTSFDDAEIPAEGNDTIVFDADGLFEDKKEETEEPEEKEEKEEKPAEDETEPAEDNEDEKQDTEKEEDKEEKEEEENKEEDEQEKEETGTEDNSEEKETEDDSEEAEDDSEKEEEKEETADDKNKSLSKEEKLALFQNYLDVWKQVLKNMERESYSDLTIDEKADFWDNLSNQWGDDKEDPREFMGSKNVEAIEKLRITL